jgi:hypothetical protein
VERKKKTRGRIPKATAEAVLKEFNHRCALCGADRPHLHHIDENPANNDRMNLIPLCPNDHLGGQHDATNRIPQAKLAFFRRYKHRNIMKPQFNPIFARMAFLNEIAEASNHVLATKANELTDFVQNFEKGPFYAPKLQELLKPPLGPIAAFPMGLDEELRYETRRREDDKRYREQLQQSRESVEQLIVEMLEFQVWPSDQSDKKRG